MKRVALFFGSFNPVHKGHIALAESILEQGLTEEVWFVLSPLNPFKEQAGLWPEAVRAERLKTALANHGGPLFFCDAELHLPKPSYTVQTLEYLWRTFPDCRFSILMGEDNLADLHKWKEYKKVVDGCEIYVYPRNGTREQDIYPIQKEFPEKIHLIACPLLDISSTQIRAMLAEGKDVSELIP